MTDVLDFWEKPQVEELYMIVGWRQWADAGSISSGLPQYLVRHTEARKIGVIRPEDFYLFQIPGTHELDESLKSAIRDRLRADLSPRHVPDEIIAVEEIPYTLSGKKMEIPVRKILMGHDPQNTINRGAMRNPQAIDFFIDFAGQRNAR